MTTRKQDQREGCKGRGKKVLKSGYWKTYLPSENPCQYLQARMKRRRRLFFTLRAAPEIRRVQSIRSQIFLIPTGLSATKCCNCALTIGSSPHHVWPSPTGWAIVWHSPC